MTAEPLAGAGLWHFGQFRDRYATDGYGPPVSTLEAIEAAQRIARKALLTAQVDG
ncbi:hypothetical protein [Nonomuraea sp. NPDC050786]|uniref:hypothetical protein n=1 Tax=Nonomuraea sp. NPDC050786 TaxID=3154840 RepID=UPI0033D23AA2